MISLDGMDANQVEIKKEIGKTFMRMGLISLGIGMLAICIGFIIEQETSAIPPLNLFPLLMSVPFIFLVNWLLMRRLLKKIQSHPSGHD